MASAIDYLKWNNAIAARFFNPDSKGKRVFLYVMEETVNEIGAPFDADVQDFVSSVKIGPPWITRYGQSICQQALQAFENWRERNLTYPPYVGYLALFVLADTLETDFSKHAYYPGLRILLGEEAQIGTYPSFDRMYLLWDDLAVWSNQDKEGEWGVFYADIAGQWIHVGLPRAQTILTEQERQYLPLLFAENGFDPHSPPSDEILSYLLADDTLHRLRPRTRDLLRSKDEKDQPMQEVLIEAVLDELENWDGSVPAEEKNGHKAKTALGNLRLAMVLDTTANTAHVYLRCRSIGVYPEEGLKLTGGGLTGELYCFDDWQGWSTPLSIDELQTKFFDAAQLDWLNWCTLTDAEHSWRVALVGRPIRVLVSARQCGFSGFVEESQLQRGKNLLLLAHESCSDRLEKWGRTYCNSFTDAEIRSGLPSGWRLYSVEQVISDEMIRESFPYLGFPRSVRIQLKGGLKLKGNQYFPFALPEAEIGGTAENVQLYCNDRPILSDPETGLYDLPSIKSVSRLIIEARLGNECVKKRTLYTASRFEWQSIESGAKFDQFGERELNETCASCSGVMVEGYSPPPLHSEIFLPRSFEPRVFFVGKNPGEIVVYPREHLPTEWSPVWAIPLRKNGYAVYCAGDPDSADPTCLPVGDRKKIKMWKEILWHRRKRIDPPKHPRLRGLWRRYMEIARNAC